jgi:hypothetical protein
MLTITLNRSPIRLRRQEPSSSEQAQRCKIKRTNSSECRHGTQPEHDPPDWLRDAEDILFTRLASSPATTAYDTDAAWMRRRSADDSTTSPGMARLRRKAPCLDRIFGCVRSEISRSAALGDNAEWELGSPAACVLGPGVCGRRGSGGRILCFRHFRIHRCRFHPCRQHAPGRCVYGDECVYGL